MEKANNKLKYGVLHSLHFYQIFKKLCFGLYIKIYLVQNKFFILTTRTLFFSLLKLLKISSLFCLDYLINLVVSDLPGKAFRFRLCYILRSSIYNQCVDVIFYTNEVLAIPTTNLLYKNAATIERE